MTEFFSAAIGLFVKAGVALLVANEVRGFVLAAPVLYGMYAAGGTAMAIWIGICSIAGIAISVAPLFLVKKLKLLPVRSAPARR